MGLALLLAIPASATQEPATGRTFAIDRARSDATFAVRLIWWQTISGRFEDVQGGLRVDPDTGMARVRARIAVGSVRVHPAHYRHRLLAKNFFDVAEYPVITFVSAPLPVAELHRGGHLHGRLTLHGVTRPLSLQIVDATCPHGDPADCTFQLKGWLDRTRYGMNAHRTLVSTRVQLDLVIQLAATPAAAEPEPKNAPQPTSAASTR